jgi:hypothetical protein
MKLKSIKPNPKPNTDLIIAGVASVGIGVAVYLLTRKPASTAQSPFTATTSAATGTIYTSGTLGQTLSRSTSITGSTTSNSNMQGVSQLINQTTPSRSIATNIGNALQSSNVYVTPPAPATIPLSQSAVQQTRIVPYATTTSVAQRTSPVLTAV